MTCEIDKKQAFSQNVYIQSYPWGSEGAFWAASHFEYIIEYIFKNEGFDFN